MQDMFPVQRRSITWYSSAEISSNPCDTYKFPTISPRFDASLHHERWSSWTWDRKTKRPQAEECRNQLEQVGGRDIEYCL
ncbi:hypothetical protein K443DRAFT_674674 [Laccaria amethystina LaAM-08-1]|uniref:Uncharacterized protein n=1 Tax=Laccaria amethystina LaAM-08-1 TaxID=1095629 RepID=A0A0C9Y7B6_9AGAR|nr:hypothetical protein K443DRAFT_674674 [Laccaria amethystina LaAM-08-1]